MYQELYNDRLMYKHETKEFYLFYANWWKVDVHPDLFSNPATAVGFIKSDIDVKCPETVDPGYWSYYDNSLQHNGITVKQGENCGPS